MKANLLRTSAIVLSACMLVTGTHAVAQTAEQDGTEQNPNVAIGDIVVTADRRSQRLSEVPLSITALGGDELTEKRIEGTEDLARQVPGMNFFRVRLGRFKFTLRGIGGSAGPDISQNYKVAVFVDDVYIDRPASMDLAYFDLDRVEVLKGPQGTLYGKNAVAGAINIFTNPPRDVPEFSASVDLGNYGLIQTRFMAGGPLSDDIAGKVVFGTNNREGVTRNLTTGTDLSGQNNYMARGVLRFTPGDWDVTLAANMERNPNQPGRAFHIVGPTGHMPFDVYGPNYSPDDPYEVTNDHDTRSALYLYGASARAVRSGEDLTFTSITGFNDSNLYFTWDPDATDSSISGVTFNQTERQKATTFSQELRLNSTDGGGASLDDKLFWTVGLFYFQLHGKMATLETNIFPDTQVFDAPPGTELSQAHDMKIRTRNWAGYGQFTYNITDRLHFTGGLRYDWEQKKVVQNAYGVDGLVTDNYTDLRGKASFDRVTPKATLDYKIIDDTMVYATYSQGFLSGGFNFAPDTVDNANPFGPELATNYEIGLKSVLFDGRMILNLAAFYVDYNDLQISVINESTNLQETRNAAKAVSKGFEINVAGQVTDSLELQAAYAYADAHYTRYCDGVSQENSQLKDPACTAAGGEDLSGDPLEGYAKKNLHVGFRYRLPVGDIGELSLRGDMAYQSKTFFPGYTQPSYTTVDAGIDFTSDSERYGVGLWVRNLTDEQYVTGCSGFGNTDNGANCTISDPRMYGISFKWKL